MEELEILRESAPTLMITLLTAIMCGGAMGMERQIRGSPAGLKTFMLVCVGSATYMVAGHLILEHAGGIVDSSRIAGQIVTGIGFLGAGAIIHGQGGVTGLTTAATIWHTGAIGILIGCKMPLTGILVTAVSLLAIKLARVFSGIVFHK